MSGLIERISLINFMTHGNKQLEFTADIIFLTGGNGGGKSSILSAITLGLGGTAKDTNRQNKLGDFVSYGKQKAIITITLRNTGVDPYCFEDYGDRIIVERTITATSGSSFKIKDCNGKIVKREAEPRHVLAEIVDKFNIQVQNPCAILDQDNCKTFLPTSTKKQKYELCMKATQLYSMQQFIQSIEKNSNQLQEILEKKKKTGSFNEEQI